MPKRDTYRYRLIEGNEVKYVGITDDPERKERDLKKQGIFFAEKWEKKENAKIIKGD